MGSPQVIYAEITSKQLYQIEVVGDLQFCFPEGVIMERKWGSKGFTLTCESEHVSDILVDGLEETGISWHIVDEFPEPIEEKPIWKKRRRYF